MKRSIVGLAIVLAMVTGLGFATTGLYKESQIDVPEDLALPEGSLPRLRAAFLNTTDWDQQVKLTVMVTKVTNSAKKYDLLLEIASLDVKGNVGVTNTSTHARVIALSNVGLSQNIRYFDALVNILTVDKILATRIEAARAIATLAKSASARDLESVVDRLVQLLNDPQKYNYKNFNQAAKNDKLFEDDRAAEAIVIALGEIGDPKAFGVLLNIVTIKNHRTETIDAAWVAMKKLKWY